MRVNYWSCSSFADRVRGIPKPSALGWHEWDAWHAMAKDENPVRYWLAETLLDSVQKAVYYVPDLISDVVYWYNCRFVRHRHQLVASPEHIKPGDWAPLWNRIFYASFNEFQNFVEQDLALECVRWDMAAREKFGAPPSLFRWPYLRGWRSKEAGLDYLRWQIELGDESAQQSQNAKTMLELYTWWTETRPQRVDPMVASGWSAWCADKKPISVTNQTEEQAEQSEKILAEMSRLETEQEQEDIAQLERLAQLRWALD